MPNPSIAAQARQALAELAAAARSGPVGPATVLTYTARIQRHLDTLAEFEAVTDELADEAREAEHARAEAIRSGAALPFPTRPGLYTGTGGHAA